MSEGNHFLVSARKYRPTTWETVVGQQSITDTLRHSIESGQIAQAYLFCGPRGVGKTTCARIFANAINGFTTEQAERSFNVFELDAASNNGVEHIRSIIDQVRIPPQDGQYKVYVIDEVHMLSKDAFNAFLKTLEEPPKHAVFILATTEKHKILPTILSRCQIYDFRRITTRDIADHLAFVAGKEGVNAEAEALNVIAQRADGAMRDALSIFDQMVASSAEGVTYAAVTRHLNVLGHDVYFNVVDAALDGRIGDMLLQLEEVVAAGFDAHHFVTGLGTTPPQPPRLQGRGDPLLDGGRSHGGRPVRGAGPPLWASFPRGGHRACQRGGPAIPTLAASTVAGRTDAHAHRLPRSGHRGGGKKK